MAASTLFDKVCLQCNHDKTLEQQCLQSLWDILLDYVLQGHRFSMDLYNRVFSHDVMAAIMVSQNNETVAMLVSQTSPLGVELFSYANAFFRSNKFA